MYMQTPFGGFSTNFQPIVYDLRLPFNNYLPEKLTPGKRITIVGECPNGAKRFQIDFKTPNGIAFHFNPRFTENTIVRNSYTNNLWAKEERQGGFPFKKDKQFEIVFVCDQDRFRVSVNGSHVFDFMHRFPYSEINQVEINGDVVLRHVDLGQVSSGQANSGFDFGNVVFGGNNSFNSGNNSYVPSQQLLKTPLSIPLKNIRPGSKIQIKGRINHNANRFNINLQNRANNPSVIPLHLSVRFDDPHTGNAFVRNNLAAGSWGNEDRHGDFPFQKGADFEILLLLEHFEWKIAVNNKHFAGFGHRSSFFEASNIAIDGNVDIYSVNEF